VWLERFNHYGKFIDFDPNQMTWREASCTGGAKAVGVGNLVRDAVVAMVYLGGVLYLYIGRDWISLQGPGLRLKYEHKGDGTTTFSAADANRSAAITYSSWWVGSGAGVAAFGVLSDEDEDVCAYIEFMMGTEARRKQVIAKYASR
jgi:hypothetical protein